MRIDFVENLKMFTIKWLTLKANNNKKKKWLIREHYSSQCQLYNYEYKYITLRTYYIFNQSRKMCIVFITFTVEFKYVRLSPTLKSGWHSDSMWLVMIVQNVHLLLIGHTSSDFHTNVLFNIISYYLLITTLSL